MTTGADVLSMLLPNGGWTITGHKYEGIQFLECKPITKTEFEAGFTQYDVWKAEQDEAANNKKVALLAQLGITEEQAQLLLS